MSPLVRHIFRRAFRSLYENLYLNAVSTTVIAVAVLLMGIFLTVMFNLNAMVEGWERDVHISAFFLPDIPMERRFELKDQVATLPEVEAVHYVSEEDAQIYLVEKVPEVADVLAEMGSKVLPASLEITLHGGRTTPADIEAVVGKLRIAEFQDLDYGQQWVERFNSFLSLLKLLGVILGGLITVSTVFLVSNTIHLVVYNRRDGLETMRLVGATDAFIGIPFLIEGAVQGFVGSTLATGGLLLVHKAVILRLQNALQIALAEDPLRMLPWDKLALLLSTGILLGVVGSGAAIFRFLRKTT